MADSPNLPLYVSGIAFVTSLAAIGYTNNQVKGVKSDIDENSQRLSATIREVEQLKNNVSSHQQDPVFKNNQAIIEKRLARLEIGLYQEKKELQNLRDVICNIEDYMERLSSQVEYLTNISLLNMEAIKELQSKAIEQKWTLDKDLRKYDTNPRIYSNYNNNPPRGILKKGGFFRETALDFPEHTIESNSFREGFIHPTRGMNSVVPNSDERHVHFASDYQRPIFRSDNHFSSYNKSPTPYRPNQNYSQSPQNYSQPPQNYSQPPQNYSQPPQNYHQPPQNYHQPPQNYHQPPQNYHQPPQNYHQPPQNYSQPSQNYSQPPQNYSQPSPRGFTQNSHYHPEYQRQIFVEQQPQVHNEQVCRPSQIERSYCNTDENKQEQDQVSDPYGDIEFIPDNLMPSTSSDTSYDEVANSILSRANS